MQEMYVCGVRYVGVVCIKCMVYVYVMCVCMNLCKYMYVGMYVDM